MTQKLTVTVEKDAHIRIHIRGCLARIRDYGTPGHWTLTGSVIEKTQGDRIFNWHVPFESVSGEILAKSRFDAFRGCPSSHSLEVHI